MHGLSKTTIHELMAQLRNTPLFTKMNEVSATNNKQLNWFLVCCLNGVDVVTEHFDLFNAPVFNSATLCHEAMDVFHKREIPVKNLLAVLMDSCAVMRGCKTAFEKNWFGLRDGLVSHLLDIDSDFNKLQNQK